MLNAPASDERPGPPGAFLGVVRSLTGRAWTARLDAATAAVATAIAQRHQIPEIVARVLAGPPSSIRP